MRLSSMEFRLTAWYSTLLMAGLIAVGSVAGYAVNDAMVGSVDGGLQDQVASLQEFINTSILDDLEDPDEESDTESNSSAALRTTRTDIVPPSSPGGRADAPGDVPEEIYTEIYEDALEYVSAMPESDSVQIRTAEGDILVERLTAVSGHIVPQGFTVGQLSHFETIATEAGLFRLLDREVALAGQPFRIRLTTPMTLIVAARRQALSVLLWALPLALLVSVTGGYFISRIALRPLESVVSIASEIDVGRLSERLPVPATGDVMERLPNTINSMLGRLESSVARLDEFTAAASHEMRTPVAVIRTTAEIALRQDQSEAELRGSLLDIRQESESLTHLIENLMILARSDGDTLRGAFLEVDLASIVEEVCEKFRRGRPGGALLVDIDTHRSTEGDPDLLSRLLVILLDNAVGHTRENSTIRVSLHLGADELILKVSDDGPGIGPGDIKRIFDRFYRADRSRSRNHGRVGLGLSIAKAIVETHGGQISVDSTVGQGTTFAVRLPAER